MTRSFDVDFLESYDKDSLISELQRLATALDKNTLSRNDIDTHGRLSSHVVIKKFGSLRKALQASGLTPTRFTKPTDEELLGFVIELWTKTLEKEGRSPYSTELKRFGFPVSKDTYVRRFGSWNKALLAASNSVTPDSDDIPAVASFSLTRNKTARQSLSIRKRFLVFKRDRYRCRICGRSGVELEVDHIVPAEKNGTDALHNLQTLCFDCNRGKRNSLE